ncbi:MAG: hypothetical protein FWF23_03220 [Alphaproteobacteria bacterium]|nr:hypothetical protein [Alphaproteobacteria bacterium]
MAITRMTMAELSKLSKKNKKERYERYKKAKPVLMDEDEARHNVHVARGFANFLQYINRNGRPKVQDKKVPIAILLPQSVAKEFRSHEHYSRHIAEYVMKGLSSGKLNMSGLSKTKAARSSTPARE